VQWEDEAMTVANSRPYTPRLNPIEAQYADLRFDADENRWTEAKKIIGDRRVTLGPTASQQYLDAPEHLCMVLARYRAAAALIGDAKNVLELGCGEGIGAGILSRGRGWYTGLDSDEAAIKVAVDHQTCAHSYFDTEDILALNPREIPYDAVVSLDVIEHVFRSDESTFMQAATMLMEPHGVCVVGTPSKHAEHLASPQSRAGHVNLYTPDRLRALMAEHFHVVLMMYMQDTAIHFGHPQMAHYLLAVGIGPRRQG
jgi:2-polyprenyl-3-methyl-5-hydroxy-6-metoxy-1,4-benzoquinol methylase